MELDGVRFPNTMLKLAFTFGISVFFMSEWFTACLVRRVTPSRISTSLMGSLLVGSVDDVRCLVWSTDHVVQWFPEEKVGDAFILGKGMGWWRSDRCCDSNQTPRAGLNVGSERSTSSRSANQTRQFLLVTRGKSISKMKPGEQMVFFNENCGTGFLFFISEELTLERVRKMYLTQLSSPFGF